MFEKILNTLHVKYNKKKCFITLCTYLKVHELQTYVN